MAMTAGCHHGHATCIVALGRLLLMQFGRILSVSTGRCLSRMLITVCGSAWGGQLADETRGFPGIGRLFWEAVDKQ
jgi:hypothetical protein